MEKYRDNSLSTEERVRDLMERMTLDEKIRQTDQYYVYDFSDVAPCGVIEEMNWEKVRTVSHGMSLGSIQMRGCGSKVANELQRYAVEETRLGIPFLFSEEALHGFFRSDATCFPQQIGLAGTFEPELGKAMGRCIATEARAYGVHETFSPVMDLGRDPRYGRVEESYGEDTYLAGEFAREIVLGLQGDGLKRDDTVAAEPKHYVGYGTPVGGLNCAESAMGRRDVFAYSLPVFEQAFVGGKAWNTMCSYNSIDGVPVASDHEILTDVLRGQFGMPGFVRSDLTAVSRLYGSHHTAETKTEAIRQGLEAGVDLQLYDFTHEEWENGIRELIAEGLMDEAVLDQACARVLKLKFELGLFENPYIAEELQEQRVNCKEHQDVAQKIAEQGICLLKNAKNLLPLSKDIRKIAVVGPGADEAALGDYCMDFKQEHMVTVLDGIRELAGKDTEILYEKGCNYLGEQVTPFHPGWFENEEGGFGLTARYYNGFHFEGKPVVERLDPMIQFNWIYAKPHPDLNAEAFSVVWTGKLKVPETFEGCLGLSSQDSMRLYLDGELIVDGWGEEKDSNQMIDFSFERGKVYDLRVEFCNDYRGARVIFGYNRGRENSDAAAAIVKEADVAVVCLGDCTETSGENLDRADLNLPGGQLAFLKKMQETGTPIVLVLQSGRPMSITWEQEHIPAIVEAWFPGEKGGRAVAKVLFGEVNPSGRLPMSFPKSVGQVPCNYNRFPGGGTRYVEMDWNPLYPFGYGLSYTTFAYQDLKLSAKQIPADGEVTVSFVVKNTGNRAGAETAQVYLRDCVASVVKPMKELAGFKKVYLEPGESKKVEITIGERQMRTLTSRFEWNVEPGKFIVQVGDNAANVLMKDEFEVIK